MENRKSYIVIIQYISSFIMIMYFGLRKNSETQVVEGQIYFKDVKSSISGATIYVRLEDVSLADAPSKLVAENILRNVFVDKENPHPVPFSIHHPVLDERAIYTLAVHVDVSGDGKVTQGDYITMRSYPISASQSRARVIVHVQPVG